MKIKEMNYLVICPPGLEEIFLKTARRQNITIKKAVFRYKGMLGRIFLKMNDDEVKKLYKNPIAERIVKIKKIIILKKANPDLNSLIKELRKVDFSFLKKSKKWRLNTKVIGVKGIDSEQLNKHVARFLTKKYGIKLCFEIKIKNVLKVDLFFDVLVIGIDITGKGLHLKRPYLKCTEHPARLRTTIAAGMLFLTNIKKEDVLLDPFGGIGTIILEAIYNRIVAKKYIYNDINPNYFKYMQQNLQALKKLRPMKKFARKVRMYNYDFFDKSKIILSGKNNYVIVTDLPTFNNDYKKAKSFTEKFIYVLVKNIRKIRKICIVALYNKIGELFMKNGFLLVEKKIISRSGRRAYVFVFEPPRKK